MVDFDQARLDLRGGGFSCRVLMVLALAALAALPLLWSERREQLLALNSLYLALATCLLALPLGALLAMLVARTDVPGRRSAVLLLAALLFMPLYLQTAAWDAGFGRQGWYSAIWGSPAEPPLVGWRAVVWIHVAAAVPWITLIVALGLRRIDPELEEAALLDAAPHVVFLRVTLPQSLDALGVAALWVMLSTVGEITVTDMYQVSTYARELYIGFALGDFLLGPGEAESAAAPSGAWPGITITAWLLLAAFVLLTRLAAWSRTPSPRPPRQFRLGWARWLGSAVMIAALALVAGVPLGNLIYHAGLEVQQLGDMRVRTWSSRRLIDLLAASPEQFANEIRWTLLIGVTTATVAVLAATPLAWLARRGGWRAVPAGIVAAAGIAVPGPLIGLALIWLLNREDAPWLVYLYDRTIFAPTVAMLTRAVPWTILICWFGFRSIPEEILENAALEGAGPATRLLRVGLPQRGLWLALGWLVALAVATGDLTASILVVPPGVYTLAVRIFGLIHAGVDDLVSAICLVIVFAVAAVAAAAASLWRRAVGTEE